MSLACLFSAAPPSESPAATGPTLLPPERIEAAPPSDDGLIRQIEDDVQFTMRMIGLEADSAKAKIDEGFEHFERIGLASHALTGLSGAAANVSAELENSARRLEAASEAIRRDADGVDVFISEAQQLVDGAAAGMERLREAAGRIDAIIGIVAKIARQTKVLALNAGIEAARFGEEGEGFGEIANRMKALAAKAGLAASEVKAEIADLQGAVHQNAATMSRAADLVRRIDPVVGSIRGSLQTQGREIDLTVKRARDSAKHGREVAIKAAEVNRLAAVARIASRQAKAGGDGVVFAMRRYAQRSAVFLRNSANGNRRRAPRVPVKMPASIFVGGAQLRVTVLDVSEVGALLLLHGDAIPMVLTHSEIAPGLERRVPAAYVGERARLSLENVGDVPGTIVERSDLGCHFKFESRSDELSQRIRKIIASAALGDQPYVRIAKAAAGEVALALENGLVFGDVSLEDLITTNYHPIAGTDPVQYETRALAFYNGRCPQFWPAMRNWIPRRYSRSLPIATPMSPCISRNVRNRSARGNGPGTMSIRAIGGSWNAGRLSWPRAIETPLSRRSSCAT